VLRGLLSTMALDFAGFHWMPQVRANASASLSCSCKPRRVPETGMVSSANSMTPIFSSPKSCTPCCRRRLLAASALMKILNSRGDSTPP
jgi:hypothetical protein